MSWWKPKPPKAYQKLKSGTIEAWLVSDDPMNKRLAQDALEQLGQDTASDYLSSVFHKEQQILKKRVLIRNGIFLCFVLLGFSLGCLLHSHDIVSIVSFVVFAATIENLLTAHWPTVSSLQISITQTAVQLEHIKNTRLLVSAFILVNDETRITLIQVLTHLLPQLTFADRGLLDLDSWKELNRLAQYAKRPELVPEDIRFAGAILQALGNVRDEASLPLMQELATGGPKKPCNKALKRIAAHYVAIWNMPPVTESSTLSERQLPEEKQMLWQGH